MKSKHVTINPKRKRSKEKRKKKEGATQARTIGRLGGPPIPRAVVQGKRVHWHRQRLTSVRSVEMPLNPLHRVASYDFAVHYAAKSTVKKRRKEGKGPPKPGSSVGLGGHTSHKAPYRERWGCLYRKFKGGIP